MEALRDLRVVRQVLVEELDGDELVERGLLGLVHPPHRAFPDEREDLVLRTASGGSSSSIPGSASPHARHDSSTGSTLARQFGQTIGIGRALDGIARRGRV
jgi:hypothetical protein